MKNSKAFLATIDDLMRLLQLVMLIVFLFYCFSGITLVKPGEVAIVLRLGSLVGDNPADQLNREGWLFAFPYPVDQIIRIPEKEIREISITELKTLEKTKEEESAAIDAIEEGYCISADQNIFQTAVKVKFQVFDPVKAIFNFQDDFFSLNQLIHDLVVKEITQVAVGYKIDEILTDGKEKLALKVSENVQQQLNEAQSGIRIISIEFDELNPPLSLKYEFEQVNSAYIQRENFINEAKGRREEMLPEARAARDDMLNKAYTYEQQVVSKARAQTNEFMQLYGAYKNDPQQIRAELLNKTRSRVFAKIADLVLMPEEKLCPAGIFTFLENSQNEALPLPVDYQELYSEDEY